MDLKEIFHRIESHDTSAQLNLAPNQRHLFLYAEKFECVQELKNLLNDPKIMTATLIRLVSLSNEDIDIRYENPYDTAITIYLWTLFLQSELVGKVAAAFAMKLSQGWWAPKYAQQVLKETTFYTPTGIEEVQEVRNITYQDEDLLEMYFQFPADKDLLNEVNWGHTATRYITGSGWNDPWGEGSVVQVVGGAVSNRPYIRESQKIIINTDFRYKLLHKHYSQQNFLAIRYD